MRDRKSHEAQDNHLVHAADTETKGASFDTSPIHIVTDQQDKLVNGS